MSARHHSHEEFAWRDQLRDEAAALFARISSAHERVTACPPRQSDWCKPVSSGHVARAELALGCELPADVLACYEAREIHPETCGWFWHSLDIAAIRARVFETVAALHEDEPGWHAPPDTFDVEGRVRSGAWHRGWLPVAERQSDPMRRWLCVDTVPGPHGTWGQLIVVRDSSYLDKDGSPPPPARWVATSLSKFFERLALTLEQAPALPPREPPPAKRTELLFSEDQLAAEEALPPASSAAQRMRELLSKTDAAAEDANPPEPSLDLTALAKPHLERKGRRRGRIALPRMVKTQDVDQQGSTFPDADCFGEESENLQSLLQTWADDRGSAFLLLLGWRGEGKTDALLCLCERMARRHRSDPKAPVPLYVDLSLHTPPAVAEADIPVSLEYLLRDELLRRGLPAAPLALMRAISDGQCALMLDQADSLAAYRPKLWSWLQQLPSTGSPGKPARSVHALVCADDEGFDSNDERQGAVDALARARLHDGESMVNALMGNWDEEAVSRWLQAAGAPLDPDPSAGYDSVRHLVWQQFNRNPARALPVAARAARPLVNDPSDAAKSQQQSQETRVALDAAEAWIEAFMPADHFAFPQVGTVGFCLALTEAARESNFDRGVTPVEFVELIGRIFPIKGAAQARRLRADLRAALQIRLRSHGRFESGINCQHLVVDQATMSMLNNDVETLAFVVMQRPDRRLFIDTVVGHWRALGHQEPWRGAQTLLCTPRTPQEAGALFGVAVEMARAYASSTLNAQPTRAELQTALALTLPQPMSNARLQGADFATMDLHGLDIEDVDLSGTDLSRSMLSTTRMTRVSLNNVTAVEADFSETQLVDVSADGMKAPRSRWTEARVNQHWPTADLHGATGTEGMVSMGAEIQAPRWPSTPGVPAPYPVKSLCISRDGRWLAGVGECFTIGVWRADTFEPVWHVELALPPIGTVSSLLFSEDGNVLFSSHHDHAARAWAVADGTLIATRIDPTYGRPKPSPGSLKTQLLRDGQTLIHWGAEAIDEFDESDIARRRYSNNVIVQRLIMHSQRDLIALARDAQHAYTYRRERNGPVLVWDVATQGNVRVEWTNEEIWNMAVHEDREGGRTWLAAVEPGFIVVGDPRAVIASWRFKCEGAVSNEARASSKSPNATRPGDETFAQLCFSPNGRWLVVVVPLARVIAYDLHEGAEHTLDDSGQFMSSVFNATGTLILAGQRFEKLILPA